MLYSGIQVIWMSGFVCLRKPCFMSAMCHESLSTIKQRPRSLGGLTITKKALHHFESNFCGMLKEHMNLSKKKINV